MVLLLHLQGKVLLGEEEVISVAIGRSLVAQGKMDLDLEGEVARGVEEALVRVLVLGCRVESGEGGNEFQKDLQGEEEAMVVDLVVVEADTDEQRRKMVPVEMIY